MNKASGGDGIPTYLFNILKDSAIKVLHAISQQIWKTHQWPQDWKLSVFFPSQRKAMPKNVQTTTHCSHFTCKVRLKILQARLQQYVNQELLNVQDGFRKGRRIRDQVANICQIIEKAREFTKTSPSALLTMLKPFIVSVQFSSVQLLSRV